ncbi:MAG: protein kinase, partial [Planctomycetota bacterium]
LPRSRVHKSTYLKRFQMEAKAIEMLNHPNIVRAYDIDEENGTHFIVMEYVDGDDLQTMVRRDEKTFDPYTAARIVHDAAQGLQHAHDQKMIHRDIKPANILLDKDGTVKLLDMGLALIQESDEPSLTVMNNEDVLGTADYLAPEQALNSHEIDHRADLYGLGCTLYFMLVGRPPFVDGTLAQRIARHQKEMPESIKSVIRKSGAPIPNGLMELEGICFKLLQKDPAYRYQSASDVAEALQRYLVRAPKEVQLAGAGGPVGRRNIEADYSYSSGSLGGSQVELADRETLTDTSGADTIKTDRHTVVRGDGLSSSDSGKLMPVRRKPTMEDLFGSSALDLQVESGLESGSDKQSASDREKRRAAVAAATGQTAAPSRQAPVFAQPSGSDEPESTIRRRSRRAATEPITSLHLSRSTIIMIGLAVGLILFLAIGLGFLLAQATSG